MTAPPLDTQARPLDGPDVATPRDESATSAQPASSTASADSLTARRDCVRPDALPDGVTATVVPTLRPRPVPGSISADDHLARVLGWMMQPEVVRLRSPLRELLWRDLNALVLRAGGLLPSPDRRPWTCEEARVSWLRGGSILRDEAACAHPAGQRASEKMRALCDAIVEHGAEVMKVLAREVQAEALRAKDDPHAPCYVPAAGDVTPDKEGA